MLADAAKSTFPSKDQLLADAERLISHPHVVSVQDAYWANDPKMGCFHEAAIQLAAMSQALKARPLENLGDDYLLLAVRQVTGVLAPILEDDFSFNRPTNNPGADPTVREPDSAVTESLQAGSLPSLNTAFIPTDTQAPTNQLAPKNAPLPSSQEWRTTLAKLLHSRGEDEPKLDATEVERLLDQAHSHMDQILQHAPGADLIQLLSLFKFRVASANLSTVGALKEAELKTRRRWLELHARVYKKCEQDHSLRERLTLGILTCLGAVNKAPSPENAAAIDAGMAASIAKLVRIEVYDREERSLSGILLSTAALNSMTGQQIRKIAALITNDPATVGTHLSLATRVLSVAATPPDGLVDYVMRQATHFTEYNSDLDCIHQLPPLIDAWRYLYKNYREHLLERCVSSVLDEGSLNHSKTNRFCDWLDFDRVGGSFREAILREGLFPDIFSVENNKVVFSVPFQTRVKEKLAALCMGELRKKPASYYGADFRLMGIHISAAHLAGIDCRGLLGSDESTLDLLIAACLKDTPIRPIDDQLKAYIVHCQTVSSRFGAGGSFGQTYDLNHIVEMITTTGKIPESKYTPLTQEMFDQIIDENLTAYESKAPSDTDCSKLFRHYVDPNGRSELFKQLLAREAQYPETAFKLYTRLNQALVASGATLHDIFSEATKGQEHLRITKSSVERTVKILLAAIRPDSPLGDPLSLGSTIYTYVDRDRVVYSRGNILSLFASMTAKRDQYDLSAKLRAVSTSDAPSKFSYESVLREYFAIALRDVPTTTRRDVEHQLFGIWRHLPERFACELAYSLISPAPPAAAARFVDLRNPQIFPFTNTIAPNSLLRQCLERLEEGGSNLLLAASGGKESLISRIEGVFGSEGYVVDSAQRASLALRRTVPHYRLELITPSGRLVPYSGRHSTRDSSGAIFEKVREFCNGDDARRINKSASLRFGKPHITEYADSGDVRAHQLIVDVDSFKGEASNSTGETPRVGRLLAFIYHHIFSARLREVSIHFTYAGDPLFNLDRTHLERIFLSREYASDYLGTRSLFEDLHLTLSLLARLARRKRGDNLIEGIPKTIVPYDHTIKSHTAVWLYCENKVILRASQSLFQLWRAHGGSEIAILEIT